MRAKTLNDVFDSFQNKPVCIEEFDELYIDADIGRGIPIFSKIKRQLTHTNTRSLKLLFAGHRGCGKSTELVRLQKNIQQDFVVLNWSVLEILDILNINYIELFIATMERIFLFFDRETAITIDDHYLENIKNWVKSREIEEINQKYMGVDIEAGVKAGVNIPFFADFFAKFRASAKSSSTMKEVLRSKVEPKLTALISNCNLLIGQIKKQLGKIDKKGLVIIMEDLDKIDAAQAEDIFYAHSTQLTQLDCHCIYTFPIALLYHIKFKAIENKYENALILPMIKVSEKDGRECLAGISVMENIVMRRMDASLFEDKAILTAMIKTSGGCLWDLFHLVKEASHNALDYKRDRINRDDFKAGYKNLKSGYERTIAENKEKGVSVDEYWDELKRCANDKMKKNKTNDITLDLMNNLTLLNYNGDNWHDVHPVVKDILKERGLLEDE